MMKVKLLGFLVFSLIGFSSAFAQVLNVTTSKKDACAGASNGSISITVDNSTTTTAPYTYLVVGIVNGTSGPFAGTLTKGVPLNLNNLAVDNYFVSVSDNSPSVANFNTFLPIADVSPGISASITTFQDNLDPTCVSPNGFINISVSGGSAPANLVYSWTGPSGFTSSSQNIAGLAGGTYNLTITDNNANCSFILPPKTLTDLLPNVYNISTTTPSLCAGSIYKINVSGSDAGVTYTVLVNGVATSTTAVGTGAALAIDYNGPPALVNGDLIKVQAALGLCTPVAMNNTLTATINTPPTSATLVAGGLTTICAGSSTTLKVNVAGGTPNYDFSILNGPTEAGYASGTSITVSPAVTTTYDLTGQTITDSKGCTVVGSGSVTITVNPVPTATINASPTAICSGSSSTLTFTLTGTAPFNVTYNDGTTSFPLVGISNGHTVSVSPAATKTYTITAITDATTCSGVAGSNTTVTVNPKPTSATLVAGGLTTICAGSSTTLKVNVTGGTPNYDFTILNGPTEAGYVSGTAITVSPAVTTTYDLTGQTITDSKGCTVVGSGSVTITVNPVPTATIGASPAAICSGSSSTLTFTLTGTGPFNVTYNDGTTSFPLVGISNGHTVSVSPAATKTYTITAVTDATTCSGVAGSNTTVTVNPKPTSAVLSATGPTTICAGGSTTLKVDIVGGTPNFDFNISNGPSEVGYVSGTAITVSPAVTTTYDLTGQTITDSKGCTVVGSGSVTVTVTPVPTATIGASPTAICSGSSSTLTFTLTGTGPFNVDYTDGSATFNLVGISNGHTVNVSPASTKTYTITTATDATTCSGLPGSNATVTVNVPPASATLSGTNTICAGDPSDLVVTIVGGAAPYSFTINNGVGLITNYASGSPIPVSPGTTTSYAITGNVTDANGCTVSGSGGATITVKIPATPSLTGPAVVCFGSTTINYATEAGMSSYNWTVSAGGTIASDNIDNVDIDWTTAAGAQTVSVSYTGANGCVTAATTLNVNVADLTVTPAITDNTRCVAAFNGAISLTISGAVGSPTFSWTGPGGFTSSSQNISNLISGDYDVTVTDPTSGCSVTPSTITVADNAPTITLALSAITDNDRCLAPFDGAISITTTGSMGAPTFAWTGPGAFTSNNQNIAGLKDGNYNVTVTDPTSGCSISTGSPFVVDDVTPVISITTLGTSPNDKCVAPFSGSIDIDVSPSGAPAVYSYAWSAAGGYSNNTQDISVLSGSSAPGKDYTVVVTDATSGCTASSTIPVLDNLAPIAGVISGDATICAGSSTSLTFSSLGGLGTNFDVTYTDGTTQTTLSNILDNSMAPVSPLSSASYTIFSIKDLASGCVLNAPNASITGSADIVVNPRPTVVGSGGGSVCVGSTLPDVTFTFTGTAPFDFTYTDGTTPVSVTGHGAMTYTFTPPAIGSYIVTALTDANCSGSSFGAPVIVSTNPLPTVTISGGGPVCAGSPLPDVVFTFTGTAPFNFTYTDGVTPVTTSSASSVFTITNAPAGTYSLTSVTDANTCSATSFGTPVSVTVNALPTASTSGGGTICTGGLLPDVTFTFTGVAPFNYTYTDGVTPVTINNHPATTYTIVNAPAGTYQVTALSDNNSCTATSLGGTSSVVVTPVPTGALSGDQSICVGQSGALTITLTGAGPWDVSYSDGSIVTAINGIASSPHTFNVNPFISTTYSLVSVSNGVCGAGTASGTAAVTVNPIPGDQVTYGSDTWIGYVYNDSGSPSPPTSNINYSNAKYRGFINETDISTLGVSSYNSATDAFNLNLNSTFPLNGPNMCGSFLDDYSIRFRMKKTFVQGVYTFTVGGDDGVRFYIDGVLTTLAPANSFSPHAYKTYTTNSQCLTAGQHDLVIEYFERGGFSRVSFDYQAAAAPTVTTPVSLCAGSAAPTLTATSADPAVTGYKWYTDAALTNQVAATQNYTPLPADLDMNVVASSDFYVTAVYACGQSLAAQVNVDIVNSATINVPAPPVQICQTGGIVDLTTIVTASPAGTLTFSGTGITTSPNFDPTLVVGTSAITVTYSGGCPAAPVTFNIDVVPNSVITVPASPVSVCQTAGVQDLSLLVSGSPTGGTFTFSGSGVAGTSFDPTGLSGAVPVTVDYSIGGSCAAVQQIINFDVVTVAALTIDNSKTVCASSGSIDLTTLISANPSGGTFTFSGATGITGNMFDPSAHAGSAVVINIAYDQGGCTAINTVTVTVRAANDPLCVSGGGGGCSVPVIAKVDAACNGIANGSITINSVSGGTGPYTYSIDNGTTFQASNIFSGLAANSYSVIVKDATACLSSVFTIVIANTSTVTGSILKTDESCTGGDGMIDITNPSGGTAPYQYSIDNGVTFQAGGTFNNLGTGAYLVVIKDNVGCLSTAVSSSVVQPANCGAGTGTCATVVIVPKPKPATCTNSDGKIVFSIKPFVPAVNNTGVKIDIKGTSSTNLTIARTNFNDSTFLNLPMGTYDYSIVYGDASCVKTGQVTIDQSGTIGTPVASDVVMPVCFGQATGSLKLDVPGETGNLLEWSLDGVVWSQFTAGNVISGVPAGTAPLFNRVISVRRNSSDPCNASVNVTIQETNPEISATITPINASCSNNDGSLLISNIAGGSGIANFTYQLNGASIALPVDNILKGLNSGTYIVSIIDNVGCKVDLAPVDIKFPGFVNHSVPVVTAPDCLGAGSNGVVTFQITDIGTFQVGYTTDATLEPTNYFNPGGSQVTISALANGNYYIWLKSSGAQCPTKLSAVSVSGVYPLSFASSATDVLCFGTTAEISLSSITGAPNLDYTYELVKDGVTTTGAVTFSQSLGTVKISNLVPGNYQVRLTQNQSTIVASCTTPIASAYKDITIAGATKPLDTLYVNRVISLPDLATGSMLVGIEESEQEPYEVRLELTKPLFPSQGFVQDWTTAVRNTQNLKVELSIKNLFSGEYKLSLRDALGCEKDYTITLDVDTQVYVPNVFTPNGDGINDVFFIRNLPPDANLVITNRWGKEVYSSGNYKNDWGGGEINDGVYFYKLSMPTDSMTGWVEIMRGK